MIYRMLTYQNEQKFNDSYDMMTRAGFVIDNWRYVVNIGYVVLWGKRDQSTR